MMGNKKIEKQYSGHYQMVSECIGANGYRILSTPKLRPLVTRTAIKKYPNGLGEIEWLDHEGKTLAFHAGPLDDSYPRLGEIVEL